MGKKNKRTKKRSAGLSQEQQEEQSQTFRKCHNHNNKGGDGDGPAVTTTSATATTTVVLPFPNDMLRPPETEFLMNQAPYESSFQAALQTSYEGFVVDPNPTTTSTTTTTELNESGIQTCLQTMQRLHYFRRDVIQPFGLGTKCAKTYVTRCLVGEPGTTYKYLGLRMFAHPWSSSSSSTTTSATNSPIEKNTTTTTRTIHRLSQLLSKRTQIHLQHLNEQRKQRQRGAAAAPPQTHGRSNFDICLINCMDPSIQGLKPEPLSSPNNLDLRTTVSWHADSSLEHYSTIAVYQTLLPQQQQQRRHDDDDEEHHHHSKKKPTFKTKNKKRQQQQQQSQDLSTTTTTSSSSTTDHHHEWYVAMRVTPHAEGPTAGKRKTTIQDTVDPSIPPIAVSLPSGSAYYLLDDFNHHHQHTVLVAMKSSQPAALSSSCIRYSCTFRLLRDSHNVDYILKRCQSVISQFHKKGHKIWRSEQLLLNEIESEWIRQFYIQGSQHYDLLWNVYWNEPIQALLRYWSRLEHRTQQTIDLLLFAAQAAKRRNTNSNNSSTPKNSTSTNTPPNNNNTTTTTTTTKTERKIREKQNKALATVQGLLQRGGSNHSSLDQQGGDGNDDDTDDLYTSMANLLEERAQLRLSWTKREHDFVFTEVTPELRPIPLPFQFQQQQSSSSTTMASSPLPGDPEKLRELATSLRTSGKVFSSSSSSRGQFHDLPFTTTTAKESLSHASSSPTIKGNDDDDDNPHSKPLDWSGWSNPHTMFGLELQDPWALAVMTGKKTIETRSYELPPALVGKKVWILESPSGTAGVSAMGNILNLTTNSSSTNSCKILGWCIFTSVIRYTSRSAFQADESLHLVLHNQNAYAWQDGTKHIFGWVVGGYGGGTSSNVDDDDNNNNNNNNKPLFILATRRMRSLFELTTTLTTTKQSQNPKKRKSNNKKKKKHINNEEDANKKKKRRY